MFLEHLEVLDTVVGAEDTALNRADKSSCFHPQGAFILGKQEKKKNNTETISANIYQKETIAMEKNKSRKLERECRVVREAFTGKVTFIKNSNEVTF